MTATPWYADSARVFEFGTVLRDGDLFGGEIDNIFYYFEKPHKWDGAHDIWLKYQRPHKDEEGWDKFLAEVERTQSA